MGTSPPGMPSPPSFKKNNPNSDPIVQLYMTSPTLTMWELDDYAENTIAPRIAMMSGVSQVQVQGVRSHYQAYADWLGRQPQGTMRARREEAEMIFRRVGITFAVYGEKDEDGAGTDQRFWRLAQALSALYPAHTEEKRWVDGLLARKKGLGF